VNAYSYSAFKDFATCQKQFYYVRFTRAVRRKYDGAGEGKAIHAAIEMALKHGETDLPSKFRQYNWVLARLEKVKERMAKDRPTGITFTHAEFGCTVMPDWTLGAPFSKNGFYTCFIDLVLERDDIAYITDWKTGKSGYADLDQLYQQAMVLFLAKPNIMTIRADLTFIKEDLQVPAIPLRIERGQLIDLQHDVIRLADRVARKDPNDPEDWEASPSGLCPYCPLTKDHCVHSDKEGAAK